MGIQIALFDINLYSEVPNDIKVFSFLPDISEVEEVNYRRKCLMAEVNH